MAISKKLISGLLGGGVTAVVASFGGVKLKGNLDYNKKISYYGELNKRFSEHVPQIIKTEFYMPRWEEDTIWRKIHNKASGKIVGVQGSFTTYQKMRDKCYELINKDRSFDDCGSAADNWCTSCTWGKNWSKT